LNRTWWDSSVAVGNRVWFVHIGLDRLFGYGLKYPEGFNVTRLAVIGQVAGATFVRR
jgi:hypothetical protein